MADLLQIALECAARGWYVFPCSGKRPLTYRGFKDASKDEAQIRAWWSKWPDANVAIACGASGLAVVDCDHGLNSEADFNGWRERTGLPVTFTVRTGRRPEFGIQMYFAGSIQDVGLWRLDGCEGQIKSAGGYVVAAGSIHPDSKEAYAVLRDVPLAITPDVIRQFRAEKQSSGTDGGPITVNRNIELTSIGGKLRDIGLGKDAIEVALLQVNADRCAPPLEDDEVKRIAFSVARYDVPAQVTLGEPEEAKVKDWRERYLTLEQVRDAKPTSFFIEGFLAVDSITALAAPVAQRKSLIALNVAHALCTGEPLFGYFKVVRHPDRVVYLCPEMGLSSFSTRLKAIGLLDSVGKNLFCQTMDDTSVELSDLNGELPGSVVILDTLTRFVDGDQNSSEDMSRFAKEVFRLKRLGATVLVLHHSVKGTGNSVALTLDSAMRGSTELAAFVTSCWATRLTDPQEPYKSPSQLVNVKQRDFESKPFEVTCAADCRMKIVGEPGQIKELKKQKDAEAEKVLEALLKDSPEMGINKLQAALKDAGYAKGVKWITKTRMAILGTGVTVSCE